MASMNSVSLIGNVTRDIELRNAGSTSVCDVGLAINERVKRGDEWVDEPVFVTVTCWGRTAEIADQYLSRGSQVAFTGRLKLDQWESNEGEKRSMIKVVANQLILLGKGGGGGDDRPAPATVSSDAIPF